MDAVKNKAHALYFIMFEDKTVYLGGTLKNTKWVNMPNKKIKKVLYTLPDGNQLILGGYEKYFHMIEATKSLTGKSKGLEKLEYIYLMGKKDDKVTVYRIALSNNPQDNQMIGDIIRRIYNVDSDFINKLNPTGWK